MWRATHLAVGLLAAALVLASSPATAQPDGGRGLELQVSPDPVPLARVTPAGSPERGTIAADSIVYDDRNAFADDFIGFGMATPFYAATRFTTSTAFTLTGVRLAYRTEFSTSPFVIAVYDASGGPNNPTSGTLLFSGTASALSQNGRLGGFSLPGSGFSFQAGASFFIVVGFADVSYPMGTDDSGTGGYTGRSFYSGSGTAGDWTALGDILGNGQQDVWVLRALGTAGGGEEAPDIAVTPTSLAATLSPGVSTTLSLGIANTGTGALTWSAAASANGGRAAEPEEAFGAPYASVPARDVLPQLREQARQRGHVSVIAALAVAFRPEEMLSADAVIQQRQDIAARQEALLGRLAAYAVTSVKRFETVPFIALTVDAAALEALAADPEVIAVHEDEWQRLHLAESTGIIGAPVAWQQGFSGAGQVVAVLDSGFETNHPFFGGRTVAEACFSTAQPGVAQSLCPNGQTQQIGPGASAACAGIDGCEHGTHVAGIAMGRGNNFSGVARDARLIAVQVFTKVTDANICGGMQNTPCILTTTSDQILGLEFVYGLRSTHAIAAVNMSLGGGQYSSACDSEPQKPIIDNLRAAGIATVIASGNEGYTGAIASPACISSAVSVGSTQDGSGGTTLDAVSPFSNSAGILDLLAPGHFINSSVLNGGFDNLAGTSMAAPHVAGAWAVLKQQRPQASVSEILGAISSTGKPITDPRNGITKPRLQLDAALGGGTPGWLSVSPASGTTAPGATSALTVSLSAAGLGAGTYTGRITITSNDPDEGTVTVPVTLTVEGGGAGGGILTHIRDGDTQHTFTAQEGGYVHGTNGYGDRAKAVAFQLPSGSTSGQLRGINVYFSARHATPVLTTYSIRVYGGTPASGPQGSPLHTATFNLADALVNGDPNTASPPTEHVFAAPVAVGSTFFVSVEYPGPYGADDFNIASTDRLGAGSSYEWEQWSDNSWHNMSDAWFSGSNGWHMWVEAVMGGGVANESEAGDIEHASLEANYPNPFVRATDLQYVLPAPADVRLEVFDALGRRVAVLVEGPQPAGTHTVTWDARDLAGGVYFGRLAVGSTVVTRSMVLMR